VFPVMQQEGVPFGALNAIREDFEEIGVDSFQDAGASLHPHPTCPNCPTHPQTPTWLTHPN